FVVAPTASESDTLSLHDALPISLAEEAMLVNHRLPAATAFARVNGIDKVVIDSAHRSLSIVTAGKAYLDVRQALLDLGLDETIRSEEHTSELQSRENLVCRLLLE